MCTSTRYLSHLCSHVKPWTLAAMQAPACSTLGLSAEQVLAVTAVYPRVLVIGVEMPVMIVMLLNSAVESVERYFWFSAIYCTLSIHGAKFVFRGVVYQVLV